MMLESLKEEVCRLNLALPAYNLVVWTSGNVSARDPETGYVVIKPSGVKFEDLKPDQMVVVDLDGNIIEGDLKASSDTASHLYIYRHMPEVNGVVHTHSNYATSFAAVGKPIPPVLTAIADEFGGPIPCGGFALIGGEEIGKVVVESIGNSPACLLKNHGVFTVGPSGEKALKAAVMVEDVAKTVWIALQLGPQLGSPDEITAEDIARLHDRYTNVYGQ
jgi:L-ribulose-5-phosphate 4-epimerase